MKNLIILFCLSALSIANSYGQTIIKSNWGAIEEFYPWKDGYIGTAHKLTYAIVSKSVSFQYFDKNGNFKWETKVNPFNHSNEIVVGDHSEYAYLINKAYTKTAALEKKSATNFINLFRIDSRGKLKKNRSFIKVRLPI